MVGDGVGERVGVGGQEGGVDKKTRRSGGGGCVEGKGVEGVGNEGTERKKDLVKGCP